MDSPTVDSPDRPGPVRERLTRLRPGELSPEQRRVYDAIAGGPRAGGPLALTDPDGALVGPFDAMLRSPEVGAALQALGAAIRYGTTLSPRVREMAILAVATHAASGFEQHAHTVVGRTVGLTEAELQALVRGEPVELADPVEATALATVRALIDRGDLDDAAYARASDQLGERGVFELTALVGYYTTLALQMRVFRAGGPSPLPRASDLS